MRTRLSVWFVLAALSLNTSATQAAEMIELRTDGHGSIETPFIDAEGRTVKATLARFTRLEDGQVEVEAVDLSEAVTAHDDESGGFFLGDAGPSFSLRVSNPLVVSVSFGWVFGAVTPDFFGAVTPDFVATREGVLIEAEAGLGGGKVAAGYIRESFAIIVPIVGYDVKAALMQTWGYSWTVDPNQTYAGVEADFYSLFGKLTIGVYKRIAGQAQADDWVLSTGVGIGF